MRGNFGTIGPIMKSPQWYRLCFWYAIFDEVYSKKHILNHLLINDLVEFMFFASKFKRNWQQTCTILMEFVLKIQVSDTHDTMEEILVDMWLFVRYLSIKL